MSSEIRYARSGDVAIAYLVHGEGPIDLVFVHGAVGHLEIEFERPENRAMLDRFARYARVITFDRRGTGLSDRVRDIPTLETRMDDVRAVLDAVGSERAALFGTFEAGAMTALFAATYPERVAALVLYNPVVRGTRAPEYPWSKTPEEWRAELADLAARWGTRELAAEWIREIAPSRADDDAYIDSFARQHRGGASPGAAVAILRMAMDVDIRDVLPVVRVPTLVLGSPIIVEHARYAAERIPGSRFEEVPGGIMVSLHGEELHGPVEAFVRSAVGEAEPETVLSTVLFTDIVGSTGRVAELGDRAWADLVGRHHVVVRRQLDRQARVSAAAAPGEVLATSTVKDLVAGSGIAFEERGERELKGVPGTWRLYAVAGS